jgi:hypothetical protein
MIAECPTMVEGRMGSRVIMNIRRWVLTPLVIALFVVAAVSSVPVAAQPQPPKVDKKVEKAQKFDTEAVLRATDLAAAGQPANDFTMIWRSDAFKSAEGKIYVPFTISFPQSEAPAGKAVTMYIRAVSAAPAATTAQPPAATTAQPPAKGAKNARPEYPFEQRYFVDLAAPASATEPYRISRPLLLAPGEFDVYVTLKERLPVDAKDREKKITKTGVLKQKLTVPNLWSDKLATSTIILADKMEPLAQPLAPEVQAEHPYTIGQLQIEPAKSNSFSKKAELSTFFMIYNTGMGADKKPDVTVEYGFYQKVAAAENGEKFFNKTNPQTFNAKTLPPQFDSSQGHQLIGGISVPLGSFPEGEYRLEIKITDKLSGTSLVQNVAFVVTA